jgi:hypothetical protein
MSKLPSVTVAFDQGRIMRTEIRIVLFAALAWTAAAGAQTQVCDVPAGLGLATAVGAFPQWAGPEDTPCTFYTRITQPSQSWAAGVLKHTYAPDTRQARVQFQVSYDGVQLSTIRYVGLVSWASAQAPANGPSRIAQVYLSGVPGVPGERRLVVLYPNADNSNVEAHYIALGTANTFALTIELQTGANGYLSYWLNADPTAAPTARIPASGYLDWSRHNTLGGLSLGLFSASAAYAADNAHVNLVYNNLVADDHIFRSDFQ